MVIVFAYIWNLSRLVLSQSRYLIAFLTVIVLTHPVGAQKGYKWEYGVLAGPANYLGEMGGREKEGRPFIADLQWAKTRWDIGPYVRYRFAPAFSVKGAMHYIRISGEDALSINEGRKYRNLSFRNDIFDFETTVQWHFYKSEKPMGIYLRTNVYFSAYVFTGVGVYFHNPKTMYNGSWVALQPLKTEGVSYKKSGYCLPFGAGFCVTLVKRRRAHRIGLEVNWRYTATDYLDDVSTTYKNPATLSSHTAADLSNRNDELKKQPPGMAGNYGWQGVDENGNPINKAPRGNPNNKDSYLSINITYGVSLKGRYTRSHKRKIRSVVF